jgi:ABC-type branched-subunit amino acid transport system substrate-binding protein
LKEIMDRWNSKYGGEPFVSDASLAWDEAWILVQAMEKAQSVDPQKVFDTLEAMTEPGSLQTSFGPGRMAGIQTYGVNRVLERPIPVSHIVNGKIETTFVPIEVK